MRFLGSLIFLVLLTLGNFSWASTSIAVVDVIQILAKSEASVSINTQREVLRSSFLDEISKSEQELRQEEQELSKLAKTLSQEEFAQRRKVYEEKLIATRKKAQNKKRVLEESTSKANEFLREQLYLVVQEIASERGYQLVISNKDVIAGEKSLDITAETLKRLNAKVKKIPLEIPEVP